MGGGGRDEDGGEGGMKMGGWGRRGYKWVEDGEEDDKRVGEEVACGRGRGGRGREPPDAT